MRYTASNQYLRARAIAGTYVVILAWEFVRAALARSADGLLGFAIERTEFRDGQPVERYWLRGIKRFRGKDEGLRAGSPVPTNEHPVQSFQWGDYTAKAGHKYSYRIVPVLGQPKLIRLDEQAALVVDVETEPEILVNPAEAPDRCSHDIYFNRGVIGSQAYARRFGNAAPDPNRPESDEMRWLSRGLFEALMQFIALAKDERYALRAALYEFHYQPVANAFARAVEAGADVKIVYDAESDYAAENRETIVRARLNEGDAVIPRTVTEGIRHNKFVVLLQDGHPIAVWTGSTNISKGGIFGHSNVGHIVWEDQVAEAFAEYWERLARNLTPRNLRAPNRNATPTPAGKPPVGTTAIFSARDAADETTTLDWYAQLMADAREIVCFTVAFNIDQVFQTVLAAESDVLRYVVKDDELGDGEIIGRDRDVLFAAGGYLGEGSLVNFLEERDNPLNRNDYIHTKFMLVDPLSEDPITVTGSANFSRPSQRTNDENMLVIRGDTRVADIYFGEYMRIFDHHYARYLVRKLTASDRHDPNAGFLKEETGEWLPTHYSRRSYKEKRRRYFVGR